MSNNHRRFYQKHPIITAIGVLILISFIKSHFNQSGSASKRSSPSSSIITSINPNNSDNSWGIYVDPKSEYSIMYPKNFYIDNIQWFRSNQPNTVDFNVSSNALNTDSDNNAFSILAIDNSSFADLDHTPQSCKDDGNCNFTKLVNSHNLPLTCYDVGDTTSELWVTQAQSYICRYTDVNTDLVIWINKKFVNKQARDRIVASFSFSNSIPTQSAIAQSVSLYGSKIGGLNSKAVSQMKLLTNDLTILENASHSQLPSIEPKMKSDLASALTTFQDILNELNALQVPSVMEASQAHYTHAINGWIQATKVMSKGVTDNNEEEIASAQSLIQTADEEVKKATNQVNNYKANSGI